MAAEQIVYKEAGTLQLADTPIGDDDLLLISRGGKLVGRVPASAIKVYAAGGAPVQSVAGKTGAVTLVKADVGLGSVDNTSNATERAAAATLANKTISADTNTITELEVDNFKGGVVDLDGTMAANSDAKLASQKAIRTYTAASIAAAINGLINAAPGALDTLNELADALGDDPNFAATMVTALAGKQPLDGDLTAIAALTTATFGRSLLTLADPAALRTAGELGRFRGVMTHAAMLALTGNISGDQVFVTDVGLNGSLWVYNGSKYAPVGGSFLHDQKYGRYGAPLASITGTTAEVAFAVATRDLVANVIGNGSRFELKAVARKRGANAVWNFRYRFGTVGNTTDGPVMSAGSLNASDNATYRPYVEGSAFSATTVISSGTVAPGGVAVSGSEFTSQVNFAAPMKTTFTAQPSSASDTIDLISYAIEIWPG